MIIEGLVTNVNEHMLTFEVNKKTTVYIAPLVLDRGCGELPILNTQVKVSSLYFNADEFKVSTLILYSGCIYECELYTPFDKDNKFLDIIKNLHLTPLDWLVLDLNYIKLKRNFTSPHQITSDELIQCIIQTFPKNLKNDRVLPNFGLKFINQMRFVEAEPKSYKNFSYWTYGNHWNWPQNNRDDYLIGFLYVRKKHGAIYFTDFKRKIPCNIMNNSNVDVLRIVDNYVLIKDYVIFTEIYNDKKSQCLEYLMVNLNTLIVLHFPHLSKQKFLTVKVPESCHYDNSFSFELISKSPLVINTRNTVECWIEVMKNSNKAYFCLDSSYSEIFPLLEQGYSYQLFHKGSLQKTFYKEVSALNRSVPQYVVPKGAFFLLLSPPTKSKTLNMIEAKNQLAINPYPVTFQGKLVVKKFVDPLSSRTGRITTDCNFGTPGCKTHVLEFEESGTFLKVYLNNWEHKYLPYGLLPNMRLIVRNVVPQKGTYYKSTIMTSFEVINYEPTIKFDTADLCIGSDWGSPYFLGAGSAIPFGVIIWTRVICFLISNVKIKYYCTQCNTDNCQSCGESFKELGATILLAVTDQLGESKVIAKNQTGMLLLKVLLNAQERIFQKWCRGFELMNSYEYTHSKHRDNDWLMENPLEEAAIARKHLTRFFDVINQNELSLDLKCTKAGDKNDNLYLLLGARRS